jgi:hypothetical protein
VRPPIRQPLEPQRRVVGIPRPHDGDTQIHDGDARSAYRLGRQRPLIEILAFDKEVWKARGMSNSPDLSPEAAVYERCVEIPNALTLDERPIPNRVVADGKAPNLDGQTTLLEEAGNAAVSFVDVSQDFHQSNNGRPIETESFQTSANLQQLALSR